MIFRLTITVFILMGFTFDSNLQAQKVPELGFSEFENRLISNSDTIFVINFWATWCAPCRQELPEFEKIHRTYADDKVKVLLVSLDFPAQAEKSLAGYLKSNEITASVILLNEPDANAWIDKVDRSWSGALPATLIYKKNHKLFFEKQLTYTDIDNSISSLKQF